MKQLSAILLLLLFLLSCNDNKDKSETQETDQKTSKKKKEKKSAASASTGHWEGSFSNGMKGAKISFDVTDDGSELNDLTFQGYWRCDGKLELTTLGPSEGFTIDGDRVNGKIKEPEDGPAPFLFEIDGTFKGDEAEGTFRIINLAAGCDTYKLNWTAQRK